MPSVPFPETTMSATSNHASQPQSGAVPRHTPPEVTWSSREILEAMLASAPIAIVMVDAGGQILYTNSKLDEMFGYAPRELIGKTIEALIPERFRRDHVAHRQAFTHNPHVRSMGSGMDLAGRRKNGGEFPIEAGLSYVRVGEELIVMGSITDITRRKQTEELLEWRVEERTREIERRRKVSDGLRDILAVLNSNQSQGEILQHIVRQACPLLHADAAAIFRMEEVTGHMVVEASTGLDILDPGPADMGYAPTPVYAPAYYTGNSRFTVTRVADGIDIVHEQMPAPAGPQVAEDNTYQALLTVPLMVKGETYGNLILYYLELRRFSSEEIELATMVGDQTALAIENARLRTQIERTAIAAERSRIARDLHDSVTQTLFSASLIAEVLPRLWHRNPEETERRLEELRQLTRGALAEMRTLLLELRPATLIEVDFRELLRQLAEAITGRSRVPVTLEIEGDCLLPPDVKIAFYHIAQEALNNVSKHARASQATVSLYLSPRYFRLSVVDDGAGFVIDQVTPEHLGLSIMHERAEAIHARLSLHSELNAGTQVTVEWQETES